MNPEGVEQSGGQQPTSKPDSKPAPANGKKPVVLTDLQLRRIGDLFELLSTWDKGDANPAASTESN